MAHDVADTPFSSDADYAERLQSYRSFLRLAKYCTMAAAAVVILLAVLTL
ncbi:aa3-type cytochrome c oxidase subunit IV [Methylocella sp.]